MTSTEYAVGTSQTIKYNRPFKDTDSERLVRDRFQSKQSLLLLEFSKLFMVTKYCDVNKKKGTQHRWKCYQKNLYLQEKWGRKRIVLANSRFAENLSERSVFLTGLYFLFLFGWVEENTALVSALQMLNKILTRVLVFR